MEAVGAATGAVSTLVSLSGKIETTVNKLYERKDLTEDNKQQLLRVKRRFDAAGQLSSKLQQPRAVYGDVIVTLLREHSDSLKQDSEILESWQNQIESARRTDRVRRMKQILDRCETHLDNFFAFVSDKVPAMPESSTVQPHGYISRNYVPVNPPRLTLDYTTTDTAEGKLREAVLEHSGSRIVAFVATGKGGVGKTCALRGLADDKQVKNNFPGGTLYIQLGNDSNLADLTVGVAKIVERTGGSGQAANIRLTQTLQDACEMASDWFYDQKCLFLVDDIWKVNGIDSNVFDVLASMVNETSRLVYTTRDKHFLGRAHKVIEFMEKKTDGPLARRMLLTHAGFHETHELEGKNKTAFEAILRECNGLPLAFGIAGGAVLRQSRLKRVGREQDAWSDFYEDMERNPTRSKLLESHAEQYGALHRIVDASLEVLDKQYGAGKYQKLFRALCVLRKQQSAPLNMLQMLWGLTGLEETKSVADVLDNVSVVQMSDENQVVFVRLHDLMLDIALNEASKRCERRRFFETLIRNYVLCQHNKGGVPVPQVACSDEIDEGTIREDGVQAEVSSQKNLERRPEAGTIVEPGRDASGETFMVEWWRMDDDGYLHDNLCRILQEAGYTGTLLWLLAQPQWIVNRFVNGGINQVEQDLQLGRSVLSGMLSSNQDHEEHLEVVGKAVRLSSMFVNENPREVWFQLYGRLLWHASQNERTRAFIERIEGCAPRPWAKASMGLLQQASKGALEIIRSKGEVLCTRLEEEEVWFVWRDLSGNIGVSRHNTSTGFHNSINLMPPSINGGEVSGNALNVRKVAFWGQNRIVGFDTSLRIIIFWSRETGEVKRTVKLREDVVKLDEAKAKQWCCGTVFSCLGLYGTESEQGSALAEEGLEMIAIIADGTRLVFENRKHEIRMFDTESGDAVGEPLRGHTERVSCVAMSEDGRRIVSGSHDSTVRVWDGRSGEAVGEPLRGHTEAVWCVAMSGDGRRIVSGSTDNTVRVWDGRSGEAVGEPLRGHIYAVNCVAMSGDGRLIVSGSIDKTVRVWDGRSGEAVGETLRGHTEGVSCVSMSGDGRRIVSGSHDSTVRVWDGRSGEAVGEPLRGHTTWVSCVAMSGDGRRIVSGSLDKTVRVWDGRSGEAVGEPLRGHTCWVRCVAMSGDGRRIVSGSGDATVRVWDGRSGEAVGEPLRGHTDWVSCVAMSGDGRRIVSGSGDATVRVWDGRSGEAVGEPLRGHTDGVICVAMSGDGRRIVSTSEDTTVRVWDACTGQPVGAPLQHDGGVDEVGVDAKCSRIVSVEMWSRLERLWDVERGECVLTSADASWRSAISTLSLSWSQQFPRGRWLPQGRQVTACDEDGRATVVATCEGDVQNLRGGDCYWSDQFDMCRVIR